VTVDMGAGAKYQEVRRCEERQGSRAVWMGSGSAADLRSISFVSFSPCFLSLLRLFYHTECYQYYFEVFYQMFCNIILCDCPHGES
jgi:hypothetical protein